jgi:hypothetical protein
MSSSGYLIRLSLWQNDHGQPAGTTDATIGKQPHPRSAAPCCSAVEAGLRRPEPDLPLGDHDEPVGELIGKATQQLSKGMDFGGCPFVLQT